MGDVSYLMKGHLSNEHRTWQGIMPSLVRLLGWSVMIEREMLGGWYCMVNNRGTYLPELPG